MKRKIIILVLMAFAVVVNAKVNQGTGTWFTESDSAESEPRTSPLVHESDSAESEPRTCPLVHASVEERVQDLLHRMTREEKIGQLRCPLGWVMYEKKGDTLRLSDEFYRAMDESVGNFYGVLRADPWSGKTVETGLTKEEARWVTSEMQRYAREKTRLGIPLFFAEEAVHGHMAIGETVMPTGLMMGATFDTLLIYRMGEAVARELRSLGCNVGYGPVVDIARDPRWSRVEETMGEDAWLTGEMAAAIVRGMQGVNQGTGTWFTTSDSSKSEPRTCPLVHGVISVLKHFAAYGVPEGGLNGEQANVGTRRLMDEYIPQFRRCVEEGVGGIMTSYNVIDGVPCTGNKWLLTDVLREKWGFKGMVISDLLSIEVMANTHHVAKDYKEAARMAMEAGVDVDLQGNAYLTIKDDGINDETIDSAVARVLRLKFGMGLFDEEISGETEHAPSLPESVALDIAREGTTLLKNDGILPLRNVKKIAVIGPNADNIYNQLGDYTAPQPDGKVTTVLKGIQQQFSDVRYVKGCSIRDTSWEEIDKAVKVARQCDVTVLVVGGSSSRYAGAEYASTGAAKVSSRVSDMDCGEGYDRSDLRLMGYQERLMQALIDAKVKLVVVYIEGRPLDMNLAAERADALLTAWYPGEKGGQAIAEILTGEVNPSGRLPISIPRGVGQLPVYYSKHWSHDYIDLSEKPLFSFGYGLSYTRFEYSDLKIEDGCVSCTVKNVGDVDGDEVVQLYIKDVCASVKRPGMMLRGFSRVHIKKGESATVRIPIGDAQLRMTNRDMQEVVEPGEFEVMVGASSDDIRLKGKVTR